VVARPDSNQLLRADKNVGWRALCAPTARVRDDDDGRRKARRRASRMQSCEFDALARSRLSSAFFNPGFFRKFRTERTRCHLCRELRAKMLTPLPEISSLPPAVIIAFRSALPTVRAQLRALAADDELPVAGIDRAEFAVVLRLEGLTTRQANAVFSAIDLDGDGFITFAELNESIGPQKPHRPRGVPTSMQHRSRHKAGAVYRTRVPGPPTKSLPATGSRAGYSHQYDYRSPAMDRTRQSPEPRLGDAQPPMAFNGYASEPRAGIAAHHRGDGGGGGGGGSGGGDDDEEEDEEEEDSGSSMSLSSDDEDGGGHHDMLRASIATTSVAGAPSARAARFSTTYGIADDARDAGEAAFAVTAPADASPPVAAPSAADDGDNDGGGGHGATSGSQGAGSNGGYVGGRPRPMIRGRANADLFNAQSGHLSRGLSAHAHRVDAGAARLFRVCRPGPLGNALPGGVHRRGDAPWAHAQAGGAALS
jgi:hypothetical protein